MTLEEARRVLAALAELPAQQAIRICETARRDRIRQINREARKR